MNHSVAHHSFISQWRAQELQYVTLPKQMLQSAHRLGLGADEILMYRMIQSRSELSFRNNWVDEKGNVYVIYTREQAAETMKWSYRKTISVFQKLRDAGLIYEVSQRGVNNLRLANRTYARFWNGSFSDENEFGHGYTPDEIREGRLPLMNAANIGLGLGSYYAIPRILIEHKVYEELSIEAKLLYVIALDALHVSILYGTVDEEDVPYCVLKPERLCVELQCSPRSLTRYYKELTDIGLMERRKRGLSPLLSIYLRDFALTDDEQNPPVHTGKGPMSEYDGGQEQEDDSANSAHRDSQNYTTTSPNLQYDSANSAPRTTPNLHTSQTPESTNQSEPRSGVSLRAQPAAPHGEAGQKREAEIERIKERLGFRELIHDLDRQYAKDAERKEASKLAELAIELMAEDTATGAEFIKIGGKSFRKEALMQEYEKLTRYHLETLLEKLMSRKGQIRNLRIYLHKSLTDAATRHDAESFYIERDTTNRRSAPSTLPRSARPQTECCQMSEEELERKKKEALRLYRYMQTQGAKREQRAEGGN